MFDFLKKKTDLKQSNESLIEVACLLIHASKIDENYTEEEKDIIKKTILSLGAENSQINKIISSAESIEQDSNQILDFTKKIKNVEESKKILIVEALWKIIYSDTKSDMYEANLMRRLTGLLYLNPKDVGDIKEKIIKNHSK